MRAWRAASASLVIGPVLLALAALALSGALGDVEAPGGNLPAIVVAIAAALTALYIARAIRLLRVAAPAPEALIKPIGPVTQVMVDIADDLLVPLILIVGQMPWFAALLLIAYGARHLIEGALIVRWERRHHTHVLRTGGFLKPERLILAH